MGDVGTITGVSQRNASMKPTGTYKKEHVYNFKSGCGVCRLVRLLKRSRCVT
jgi:hypothetical protein